MKVTLEVGVQLVRNESEDFRRNTADGLMCVQDIRHLDGVLPGGHRKVPQHV